MLREYHCIFNDAFNEADQKILTLPKTKAKLEQILSKFDKDFSFVFFGSKEKEEEYYKSVRQYIDENVKFQSDNHLILSKNMSTGDPLTPWMILHCIGHAFSRSDSDVFDTYVDMIDFLWSKKLTVDEMKEVLQYKTWRDHDVPMHELCNDLYAEFLWHDKIRVNPKYETLIRNYIGKIEYFIMRHLDNGFIICDFNAEPEVVKKKSLWEQFVSLF